MNEEDLGAGKQKRRMFWNQEHQKAEKWDAQQGAMRRDSVQNAGGEYIRKPILPWGLKVKPILPTLYFKGIHFLLKEPRIYLLLKQYVKIF